MCRSVLVQARTDASFVRETGDGRLMRVTAYFTTPPVVVNNAQDYNIDTLQPTWSTRWSSGIRGDRILTWDVWAASFYPCTRTVRYTAPRSFPRQSSWQRNIVLSDQHPKQWREMLRLERVVGVIPTHSHSTSFVKWHRLRTLSKRRGVELSHSNKTNTPFWNSTLHICERFGLPRE